MQAWIAKLGGLIGLYVSVWTIDRCAAPGYQYSVVGNPADVVTSTSGLLVLQGGGTDVDENFVRMGARAGGGDFVVIRASGTDAYNPYIYDLCSCDSVATIVFKNRNAAFDPFVIETIRNAEALFIAGGDQSDLRAILEGHADRGCHPSRGREAGARRRHERGDGDHERVRVLGDEQQQPDLRGRSGGSVPSRPYARPGFPGVAEAGGLITDQHLQERDRMGRTVAFLARLVTDGWTAEGRAIAADRETALHVDPTDGTAEVFRTPAHPTPFVYFLTTPGPPEVCEPDTPLTYRNVDVYRIGPGNGFDLDRWRGTGGIGYTLTVEAGVLTSSRGEIY